MSYQNVMNKEKGFFSNLSPKASFFLGLGGALVLFFVVGFFVLLGIVVSDKNSTNSSNSNTAEVREDNDSVQKANQNIKNKQDSIKLAPVTDKDWIRGRKDAKITLIEFSDTECPYCKKIHPTLKRIVEENPEVRWVYRHFPLVSLHPKAPKEAEALECAGELGGNDAFWAYLDRLFEITPANNGLDLNELPNIAKYVGLNENKFKECLDSGKYAKKVQDHYNQAVAAGGRGTPYSIIITPDGNKIPISGAVSYTQLKQLIDSLL